MKNFRAADKSHAGGDEKHDINFHWPYQGRRKVDNLGGGRYSYIHVLHHLFPLKAIVFTVCEHEYMNICPPPPPFNYRLSGVPVYYASGQLMFFFLY